MTREGSRVNEIRWRIVQLNEGYGWDLKGHTNGVGAYGSFAVRAFPEIIRKCGRLPSLIRPRPIQEIAHWFETARGWLWANRRNFKYDGRNLGYVLKGPDLYDPQNPPRLPDEIKGPPRPTPELIKNHKKTIQVAIQNKIDNRIKEVIASLDHDYARWLTSGQNPLTIYAPGDFLLLRRKFGDSDTDPRISLLATWTWMQKARHWLWANRRNFRLNSQRYSYILKGPDRYDPQNPPKLPSELKGPPRPSPELVKRMEDAARAAREKEKKADAAASK